MAHYIDKDRIVAVVEKLMYAANTEADIASTGECFNEDIANAKYQLCKYILGVIDTLEVKEVDLVNGNIDKMKQEEPAPPGIQEESEKKGWLDYGLMIGEIGLHRYNAIRRIKEHKEQFNPLAIPDLYHVSEYYKSVGTEEVCCCLQAYSKDFMFTQDEVKEIIEKEMEADKNKTHKGEKL